jgi:stage V sporulation protein K
MSQKRPVPPTPPSKKRIRLLDVPEIKNLDDLIEVASSFKMYKNIDCIALWNILPSLKQLQSMIGMEKVKMSIFQQIIYYLQGMHRRDKQGEYLHMRIVGPPGTGKTTIAHIIAEIYVQLDILKGTKEGQVKLVHRDDFVAGYVGQTSIKTKKLLTSCLGGVMLYDEGYSMGSNRDDDSFAKEAVDALTSFLSEHRIDFCFIVAGYEEDIEKYFFSMNKGLSRRIPWYHKIDSYTPENLARIALKMISDINWKCEEDGYNILVKLIKENSDLFKHAGGDVENFLSKAKIAHANRVFVMPEFCKFTLIEEDFTSALKSIKENLPKVDDKFVHTMYT